MNEPRQLAKVLADSLSPHKVRLTTMEVVMPRIVLAEFNTHRMLSKSSASSRAIPIEKMLQRVEHDPYIPEQWDRNGAGMQGHGAIEGDEAIDCDDAWLFARDKAIDGAKELLRLNVHKQWANRLLEPFMWHTVIVTATEWSNFFHLRCHPAAHPAIRNTAEAMREAMAASTPTKLEFGEWHLPLVDERDADVRRADKVKLSVARCARVSYLTHEGIRDPQADISLLDDKLLGLGHMAPLEHSARPMHAHDVADSLSKLRAVGYDRTQINPAEHFSGNFRGWVQYRKTIAGEADILAHRNETTP